MKNIAILGSTGSIGCNTLSVIRKNSEKYRAFALVGARNSAKMIEQCTEFKPNFVAMSDECAAKNVKNALSGLGLKHIQVLSGDHEICQLMQHPDIDDVMSAIVGAAGLKPTLSAIENKKRILLANKESLVTCGSIFMNAVKQHNVRLLPVDSEHNAIFQSLPPEVQFNLGFESLSKNGITKIVLTGSGGPFRETALENMPNITPEQAVNHPNWSMGAKISVDSATMMNKGLEYIEARWLFNASDDEMEIIIHPQSIIHSMVRYRDGSIIAELGEPDMQTPIAYALSYPERIESNVPPLDFSRIHSLSFVEPDYVRYPCLKLAIDASKQGQSATTILNAANEVAVDAFLNRRIKFTDIAEYCDRALQQNPYKNEPVSVDEIIDIDRWARLYTMQSITD